MADESAEDLIMRISSPKRHATAFRTLLDLEPKGILDLLRAMRATSPCLAPPSQRALLVCHQLNKQDLVSELEMILEDVVFPAHDQRRQIDINGEEYYEIMTEFIDQASKAYWPDEYKAKWREYGESLIALFGDEDLSREAKARFLLNSRPNRVSKLRLFTELRPVFGDGDTIIHFSIISNTLRVDYKSNEGVQSLNFSLDSDDLDYLEAQITRAKAKNKAIEEGYGLSDRPALSVQSHSGNEPGSGD